MYRSAQEKSSFFSRSLREQKFSNANFRGENSARFRVSSRRPFFIRESPRRHSSKTRGDTPRKLAEKLRELSPSFSANFRADTPRNLGVISNNVNSLFIYLLLFCLICGWFYVPVNNCGHVKTVS